MKIIGTGSALPHKVVTNDMLSGMLNTSDEWISTRTGIKERRVLTDDTLVDIAVKASLSAIEESGLKVSDLDFILCSNVINNYVTPSLSTIIQGRINATCACMDMNNACSGFIYALAVAEAFIKAGTAKNILVVGAEEPTKMVDWNTRETCVLFGDGAGAVVVTEGNNLQAMRLTTKGNIDPLFQYQELEYTPFNEDTTPTGPLVMKGREVFRLAVESSLNDIEKVMQEANIGTSDVSYYLLHQANERIIDSIQENLKEDAAKFPKNLSKYGNTSSASIPILLDEINKEGKLKKGNKLVISAFGAGFSTAACVLEW